MPSHGCPDDRGRKGEATISNHLIDEWKARITTDTPLDELGPVDSAIVEFPEGASDFTGEMAAELVALVDAGRIRVIDVLILTKNEDGSVDAMELSAGESVDAGSSWTRAGRQRRPSPRTMSSGGVGGDGPGN